MEPIEPNDSRLFCQQRLDAIAKSIDSDVRDSVFKKMMTEMWHEELVKPHQYQLSVEEVIEKYGHVLTEKELDYFNNLIKNKNG